MNSVIIYKKQQVPNDFVQMEREGMKRKYYIDKQIESMEQFTKLSGCRWYILVLGRRPRTVHREMLKSQQYRVLLNWINSGLLFTTKEKEDVHVEEYEETDEVLQ